MTKEDSIENLFIDSNIYLSFYDYTKDQLSFLEKIRDALKDKKIRLFLNQQVRDEFVRNRDSKIHGCLDNFEKLRMSEGIPRIAEGLPGAKDLQDSMAKLTTDKKLLLTTIKNLAGKNELGADKLIAEIFALAHNMAVDDEIISRAKSRYDLGNPPGKKDSIGDAINWESLLHCKELGFCDLSIVSEDKDFRSAVDETSVHAFLKKEYKEKKSGNIRLFRLLSSYFNHGVPELKIVVPDSAREIAIKDLVSSGSFAATHSSIATLAGFSDFSLNEVEQMIDVLLANNQVYLIIGDPDMLAFYRFLSERYYERLDPWRREILHKKLDKVKGD